MDELYQLAMRKLSEVHERMLGDGELAAMHDNTLQSYWQEVVSAGHVMEVISLFFMRIGLPLMLSVYLHNYM